MNKNFITSSIASILLAILISTSSFAAILEVDSYYLSSNGYANDENKLSISYTWGGTNYENIIKDIPFSLEVDSYTTVVLEFEQSITGNIDEVEYSFVENCDQNNNCATSTSSIYNIASSGNGETDQINIYYKGGPYQISSFTQPSTINVDDIVPINWTADSGVFQSSSLLIELSRNGGTNWETLTDVAYNSPTFAGFDGSFDWTVTGAESQNCKVRYTLSDYAGNEDIKTSNVFAIGTGCPTSTEEWTYIETVTGGAGSSIIQTNDDGYFAAGTNGSKWTWMKMSPCGDVLWTGELDYLNGMASSPVGNVRELIDGSIVIIGHFHPNLYHPNYNDPNYASMYIVKLSSAGQVLFSVNYPSATEDFGVDILEGYDGNLLALRRNYTPGKPGVDHIQALHINPTNGALISSHTFNDLDFETSSFEKTSDGNYILAGYKGGIVWTAKINSSVDATIWSNTYSFPSNDVFVSNIQETIDGGFIIGASPGYGNGMLNTYYFGYLKTNSIGQEQWRHVDNPVLMGGHKCQKIIEGYDKGYILVINITTKNYYESYLNRNDRYGVNLWQDQIESNYSIVDINRTNDNGYIITGAQRDPNPNPAGTHQLVIQKLAPETIPIPCCSGMRGNADYDLRDEVDISDLMVLVSFVQQGGTAPVCLEESNADGDAGEQTDISDLVYIVDFIFNGGAAPASCP